MTSEWSRTGIGDEQAERKEILRDFIPQDFQIGFSGLVLDTRYILKSYLETFLWKK